MVRYEAFGFTHHVCIYPFFSGNRSCNRLAKTAPSFLRLIKLRPAFVFSGTEDASKEVVDSGLVEGAEVDDAG